MKLESKTGIVILGHGSKLREANDTIHEVVEMIKKKGWDIVDPAYLQFGQPDLSQSIKNVVQKGCRRVVIVPLFLFMGSHVSIDIPKM
ncbi:sirohydrochlorin chelatase, partial [Candidatus Hakubella thermalkaliphila]